MSSTHPRATIARLPFLLDREPIDQLMILGLDPTGTVAHAMSFPTRAERPLDDPLLESSLWGPEISDAVVAVYTDRPALNLQPLMDAWAHQGRATVGAVWAGAQRWRSYLCETEGCCTGRGNRYTTRTLGHDDYDPLPERPANAGGWRQDRWGDWMQAIADVHRDLDVDPGLLELLARTLHDIPIRDAVLAYSADADGQARPGLDALLQRMMQRSTLGSAVPVHTCAAALLYLDGDMDEAAHRVRQILETEEYSLARLLSNGLDMRAPASLLARSFAHYSPQQLLATDMRAA